MNNLAQKFVDYVYSIAEDGFLAYGVVFAQIKAQVEEKGLTFVESDFWEGKYTTRKNAKGIETDMLDSYARRQATSTFKGFNPKTGAHMYETDELANMAWRTGINLLVRDGGIRSKAELDAAIASRGSLEAVLRDRIKFGRIAGFGRRVAKAYNLKAKTVIKAGFAGFDTTELGELHAKLAIAKLVDDTLTVSGFYGFVTDTLKGKELANKAIADATQPVVTATKPKGKKVA